MTETKTYKHQYYNIHHKNLYIYKIDRYLESFNYHLDRYLNSLELRSRFSRFKENYLKPTISYFKTIKIKPIKKRITMKRIIDKIRMKLIGKKYTNCIIVLRAKGLDDEEILQEFLTS